jgi:hypothetical protein
VLNLTLHIQEGILSEEANVCLRLLDMNISFIGFILLYSFPELFWVLHIYLMPERFDGQMGFGNTGANTSKMRM